MHDPDREDQFPSTPVRSQLRDTLEISVRGGRVCGRHTNGDVSCGGDNGYGQLGDSSRLNLLTPVRVDVITLGRR